MKDSHSFSLHNDICFQYNHKRSGPLLVFNQLCWADIEQVRGLGFGIKQSNDKRSKPCFGLIYTKITDLVIMILIILPRYIDPKSKLRIQLCRGLYEVQLQSGPRIFVGCRLECLILVKINWFNKSMIFWIFIDWF